MLTAIVEALLVLSALRGASALRNQSAFWARSRTALGAPPTGYAPKATIVAPVKGVDPDFDATLAGLLGQRYGAPYELLFVVQSERDPAFDAIRRAREKAAAMSPARVEVIVAGRCTDRGQKVHNQTEALKHASPDSQVFAFVDSDGRPGPDWLANLVEPLAQPDVGVATGFRWYVPIRGGFPSSMASLWNAMAVTLVGGKASGKGAFAWGGAMALRRETFARARVEDRWRGSVSDDGGVSVAVKAAGLSIAFVPKCLVPSLHDFTFASLWEFVVRQYVILRVYTPGLYRLAVLSMALSVTGFAGGLALSIVGLAIGHPSWAVIALTSLVYALNVALGDVRYRNARAFLPAHAPAMATTYFVYLLGGPLAWGLNLAALCVAGVRRTLVWRGIRYELRSPSELVVVHPETS